MCNHDGDEGDVVVTAGNMVFMNGGDDEHEGLEHGTQHDHSSNHSRRNSFWSQVRN